MILYNRDGLWPHGTYITCSLTIKTTNMATKCSPFNIPKAGVKFY